MKYVFEGEKSQILQKGVTKIEVKNGAADIDLTDLEAVKLALRKGGLPAGTVTFTDFNVPDGQYSRGYAALVIEGGEAEIIPNNLTIVMLALECSGKPQVVEPVKKPAKEAE